MPDQTPTDAVERAVVLEERIAEAVEKLEILIKYLEIGPSGQMYAKEARSILAALNGTAAEVSDG